MTSNIFTSIPFKTFIPIVFTVSLCNCSVTTSSSKPLIEEASRGQSGQLAQTDQISHGGFTVYDYPSMDETESKSKNLSKNRSKHTKSSSPRVESIINTAYNYLGTPYRYGGMTHSGIDCSALIYHSFKSANITMPRSSRLQANKGISVSRNALRKGDLVFFATGRSRSNVSHVGIVVDKNLFIHASSSRGVMVSTLSNTYWSPRYLFSKRIITQ